MSAHLTAAWVLVMLGTAVDLLCCLGLLRARSAMDRLHFVGPAAGLAPFMMAAAIVAQQPISADTLKIALIGFVMAVTAPVVTHATARCIFLRTGARLPAGRGKPS